MSQDHPLSPELQQRLDHVIAQCLAAIRAGVPPDRAALMALHPDLADHLQTFFAAQNATRPPDPSLWRTLPGADQVPDRPPSQAAATLAVGADAAFAPTVSVGKSPTPDDGALLAPAGEKNCFGDYLLLEPIARGGMGVVFKARQVSLNRIVALKMILAGQFASDADVQRFHAEAEAAANLDHPGIVPIHEVGQHAGQHYYCMGFVEGRSLARRVVDGPLPPREAAELVMKVAQAVAHAHVHGVIHRDLKPGNILLDMQGQPRVTDFGLAKRVEGDSSLTATGQVLGTPSYMPPEQAAGKADEVGPLADVYSLGAVLYTVLVGRPPFQAATVVETLRQVLEREPVPPRQLNHAIDRDLETICLKCLQKEPARRYGSATALGDDLHRYLSGEPIQARPVGRIERTWRWCRRNRAVASLLAFASVLVVALIVGGAMTAIRFRAKAQLESMLRTDAEEKAQQALQVVKEFLTDVSETEMFDEPKLQPMRMKFLERALNFYENFAQQRSDDPEVQAELASTYLRVAEVYHVANRNDDMISYLSKGLDAVDQLRGEYPDAATSHQKLAGFWQGHRSLHRSTGRPAKMPEALATCDRFIELWGQLATEYPDTPGFQSDLAAMHLHVAEWQQSPAEVFRAIETARTIWERLARDYREVPRYRADWALAELMLSVHRDTGTTEAEKEKAARKAAELFEKLAVTSPKTAFVREGLANCYYALGVRSTPDAEKTLEKAQTLFDELLEEFPGIPAYREGAAEVYQALGHLRERTGRPQQAELAFRRALELAIKLTAEFDNYDWLLRNVHNNLARLLLAAGRAEESVSISQQIIEHYEKRLAANPQISMFRAGLARTYVQLGGALVALKRPQEAEKAYDKSVPLWEVVVKEQSGQPFQQQQLGHLHWSRAQLFAADKRFPEAAEAWRQGAEVFRRLGDNYPKNYFYHQEHGWSYLQLGWLWRNAGEHRPAEEHFRKALEIHRQVAAKFPSEPEARERLARSIQELTETLLVQGNHADAAKLAAELPNIFPDRWAEYERSAGYLARCNALVEKDAAFSGAERKRAVQAYADLAKRLLGDSVKACPANSEAQNNLAWRLVRSGGPPAYEPAEVVALAQKAVAAAPDAAHVRHTLGVAQHRAGDYARAIETLRQSAERYGGNLLGQHGFFLAMAYWQLKEHEKAGQWYAASERWMAKYGPANEELAGFRAEAAALLSLPEPLPPPQIAPLKEPAKGPPEPAWQEEIEIYSLVVGADPQAAWAYRRRGWLYQSRGELPKALVDFERAKEVYAGLIASDSAGPLYRMNLSHSHFELGNVLVALRRSAEAGQHYREAIALREKLAAEFPQTADYHSQLAQGYRGLALFLAPTKRQDAEKAWRDEVGQYDRLIELKPDNHVYWNNRGVAHAALGQHDKAIADYTKALDAAGGANTVIWSNRAFSYAGLGQWDKVVADYARVLELQPENVPARARRAAAYEALGQWDKAVADHSEVIRRQGEQWAPWARRGAAHAAIGKWAEAAADITKAIALKADQPMPWYHQALLALRAGETQAYRNACAGVLERFSKSQKLADVQAALWTCVLAPQAVSDLGSLVKLAEGLRTANPKDHMALRTLGAVLYRTGQYEAAAERLTEADRIRPKDAPPYDLFFLAMSQQRLGKAEEARQSLAKTTPWLKQVGPEKTGGASGPKLTWNQRLTLDILRSEAEAALKTTKQ